MLSDTAPHRPLTAMASHAPRAVFERLYADHATPILNYLFRLTGDSATAEDLLQETFVRVWGARADYPRLHNPRAWVYRIATNLARDHARRARLLAWLPFRAETDPEPALIQTDDPADPLEAAQVQRALRQLREEHRVPLVLYTCQHLSVAEIAETLQISPDAVKQRLVRAREHLRQLLPHVQD